MTEPVANSVVDTPGKQTRRPHPLTPLLRGWFVFVGVGAYSLKELIQDRSQRRAPWWETVPLEILALIILGVALLAALVGFLTWYFTKFVIDADEVRVETGWLFRQSKRIAIDRIQSIDVMQPFAARVFGLAELKIDVGANAATRLRYLSRAEAYDLRELMLARAHGLAPEHTSSATGLTKQLTDTRDDEVTLITVKPADLIIAGLFSTETLGALAFVVTAFALATYFELPLAGFIGIVPALFGVAAIIKQRIFDQFNYRLTRSSRGLKTTRGLLSLTSQSIPLERIQGVRITQSLMWRALGKYRVQVDVLGYGHHDGEGTETSNILLPVGGPSEVARAVNAVLPAFDVTALQLRPSSPKARWLRPFFHRGLQHALDDTFVVAAAGRWGRRADIVPVGRIQSVAVHQGPLQRRLGLVTVSVHTPPGPVDANIVHVDQSYGFALATDMLERAARTRARH